MLSFKNVDPAEVTPDTSLLELIQCDAGTLPAFGTSKVVASRNNLGGYLEYTSTATEPQWCIGIITLKQKQTTMQSIAARMLVGGMSVAELTFDFDVMHNIFLAQTRYLNPFLLFPKTKVTLGIWLAANGSQVTSLDGSCEIRLFNRS